MHQETALETEDKRLRQERLAATAERAVRLRAQRAIKLQQTAMKARRLKEREASASRNKYKHTPEQTREWRQFVSDYKENKESLKRTSMRVA